MIPSRAGTFSPTSIASLGTAFNRQALNQDYAQQMSGSGKSTVGDTIRAGLQINYLAMLERAFRERHKTDVRCQMHVTGRRIAHGLAGGVHTGSVQAHVQSFINNNVVQA
jgi:hypothetical protein